MIFILICINDLVEKFCEIMLINCIATRQKSTAVYCKYYDN